MGSSALVSTSILKNTKKRKATHTSGVGDAFFKVGRERCRKGRKSERKECEEEESDVLHYDWLCRGKVLS